MELKFGYTVRVKNNKFFESVLGTVIDHDSVTNTYQVAFDGGSVTKWFPASQLELVLRGV